MYAPDKGDRSLFISIHADAFHIKNGAKGGRFFYYSHGGREIKFTLTDYLRSNNYDLTLRGSIKRNFKVLRETSSPAVLFVMGFMTAKNDLDFLLKDSLRNKTAKLLYMAFQIF